MTTPMYDRLMTFISILLICVLLLGVLLPVWELLSWADYARVAATAVVVWVALAVGLTLWTNTTAKQSRTATPPPPPRSFQ